MKWNKGVMCITTALLAVTMVMAGCSKKADDQAASKGPTATGSTQPDVTFPLSQKITLTAFAKQGATNPNFADMQLFKDAEKNTNVHIDWTLVKPEALQEQKTLLFASNQLPDIFYGTDVFKPNEIVTYGSQGFLQPLENLIPKDMPNLSKVFKEHPAYKAQITAPDGHIYTLPMYNEGPWMVAPDAMFINKTWLDKLGLPIPTTTDQFYSTLKAFKTGDPNGNGKADEIPFSFVYKSQLYDVASLSGSFGLVQDSPSTDYLEVKDGKLLFAPVQPEHKQFADYLHSLYKDGLIDPEAFTQQLSAYQAKMKSKEQLVGVAIYYSNGAFLGKADPGYVAIPPLKGPSGTQMWNLNTSGYSLGAFAISTSNKQPDVSLKWMDQFYSEDGSYQAGYGPYGINLQKQPDGSITNLAPPAGMSSADFRNSQSPGSAATYIITSDMWSKLEKYDSQKEKMRYTDMYRPFQPKEMYPKPLMTPEDTKTLTSILSDIQGYVETEFPRWVIDGGTDADWNSYAAQLDKMGLKKMMDIYQKYYDQYLKNMK